MGNKGSSAVEATNGRRPAEGKRVTVNLTNVWTKQKETLYKECLERLIDSLETKDLGSRICIAGSYFPVMVFDRLKAVFKEKGYELSRGEYYSERDISPPARKKVLTEKDIPTASEILARPELPTRPKKKVLAGWMMNLKSAAVPAVAPSAPALSYPEHTPVVEEA